MSRRRRLCPTPDKRHYRDRRDAVNGAKVVARGVVARGASFDPLYGYACGCGRWHLTRKAAWNEMPNVLLWAVSAELQAWARGGA